MARTPGSSARPGGGGGTRPGGGGGARPGGGDRSGGARSGGRDRPRGRDGGQSRDRDDGDFVEKLVGINRVAKVVKGGRRFGFAAIVIVGDSKGRVGYGAGKAREVPEAIRKATEQARRAMIRVPLREGRTLHHDIIGRYGAGEVIVRAAPPGTGIIAGGPMRAIFEALGVHDVVAKSVGTSNPHNMIKATFQALTRSSSPRSVAQRRGRKVSEILGRRDGAAEARE
jgi:small subunit ribosomal protein S5